MGKGVIILNDFPPVSERIYCLIVPLAIALELEKLDSKKEKY